MSAHSATVGAIAAALAAAQAEMGHASKDAKNPHFKSTYATLASVLDATRPLLARHKIAVTQHLSADGKIARVDTFLLHESGEWISASSSSEARDASPQAIGSAHTYLRRYALSAICAIASDDDDGEAAQPARNAQPTRNTPRAEAAPPSMDPTWESNRAGFLRELERLGVGSEALTEYLAEQGQPIPSQLPPERRAKLLQALLPGSEFRKRFDETVRA
jgi:hypothetical protein